MQATTDAIKNVVSGEKTSSSTGGLKEYQRGYKPEPKAEKEAQGGEGSRPPGKQSVMIGAYTLANGSPAREDTRPSLPD